MAVIVTAHTVSVPPAQEYCPHMAELTEAEMNDLAEPELLAAVQLAGEADPLTTANARACISRWLAGKVAWSACTR